MMKAVNFGIDLGTTNSLIAKYENGSIILFKNPIGHKESLSSVVAFRKDRILVGDKACEYLLKDTVNVFGGFKRRMGTGDRFYVVNLDENITPVELSSYVLKELKQFIHTGEVPEAAVITIPASFDTMQAGATKEAGKKAGFREVFLLQEPVAAALAYFNNQKEDKTGHWLVYDLGGGTFDIALIEIKDDEMRVKDHEGNNFLGGTDFDSLILEYCIVPKIAEETGIPDFFEQLTVKYGKYERLYYRLLYLAEEIKKELSVREESGVEFYIEIEGKTYEFFFSVNLNEFNRLIEGKIESTVKMIESILNRNGLSTQDIREIILVGGSTLIPFVRHRLKESTRIFVNSSIDPTTAVAAGAAFYAANKYFEPFNPTGEETAETYNNIINSQSSPEQPALYLPLSPDIVYNKMSKEEEEVLLVKITGEYEGYTYRISRADGGFDTGIIPVKSKFTEFLPLLPNILNTFRLRFFDPNGLEVHSLFQEILINQGQYNISGQPLPKDICVEVDDKENNTTRLEVIFEKNSILPLTKTLYREISKTISKGSKDSIIINILEGDRFARAISNLPIGCIEITGQQLESDLIKGSDIEITISVSDNRELAVEVFLVMTRQKFENVFSLSEKQVNISRLKELYQNLETEIKISLKEFHNKNSAWATEAEDLLAELQAYGDNLFKIRENDSTDKRYILSEAISGISREFDKIGGNNRLEGLRFEYFRKKEYVDELLPAADINREELHSRYRSITENENAILRSRNPIILKRNINLLEDLRWDILWYTNTFVVSRFYYYKSFNPSVYNNYKEVQNLFISGEKAIQERRYLDLRRIVHDIFNMMNIEKSYQRQENQHFKGTGIN